MKNAARISHIIAMLVAFVLAAVPLASAHCDTLDGPVVAAARLALQSGDVTPVMKWIRPEHEAEIRDAFTATLKVRSQSPEARQLADSYFFETLVRVHRQGEGVAYTGLKPVGEIEPGIAAADAALETGKIDDLAAIVSLQITASVRQRFTRVQQTRSHADESISAGREYVEAYVAFIHLVERLHQASAAEPQHDHSEEHR